jgi:hypothetical protein
MTVNLRYISAEEHLKSSTELPNHMADLDWSMSDDPKSAPFFRAIGFEGTFWDYLAAPGNEARQAGFNAGMTAFERTFPPDLILEGKFLGVFSSA